MRPSVTARIALLAIGMALASNLALVGVVWRSTRGAAIAELRRTTVEQADAMRAVWAAGGLPALGAALGSRPGTALSDDPALTLAVLDRDGRRVAGRGPARPAVALTSTRFAVGALGPGRDREFGYSLAPVGGDWLLAARELDRVRAAERAVARALGVAVALSLALGVAAGLVLARYVARRLGAIADVVEAAGAGDLSRRVASAAGGDAFDRLSHRLNAMLDRLERLVAELRLVTDSVAHDLRQPLGRLRAKAEAAALAADPAAREASLGGLMAETDLVMRMLTTVTEIARAEAGHPDRFAPVAPAALLDELAELYQPVMEEAGVALTSALDRDVPPMRLHRELMSQAVANLLDNALRHAGAVGGGGGAVVLRLSADAREVAVAVEDRGPGIAAGDRAQALRRFGRLDRARSTPGAGLGLALVEAVARLHGGRVELADNAPGLAARIVLPR